MDNLSNLTIEELKALIEEKFTERTADKWTDQKILNEAHKQHYYGSTQTGFVILEFYKNFLHHLEDDTLDYVSHDVFISAGELEESFNRGTLYVDGYAVGWQSVITGSGMVYYIDADQIPDHIKLDLSIGI